MNAKRSKGTDVAVIAVIGVTLCCAMPAILAAVGGIGLASLVGGWLGVAVGCLPLGAAGVAFLTHRARCGRRERDDGVSLPEPELGQR